MTARVQSILDYHAVTNFGNKENLRSRRSQARLEYLALGEEEQKDLARRALAEISKGNRRLEVALCCLASFHPSSLYQFHEILLENGILQPAMLFFGAGPHIAEKMIALCDDGFRDDDALSANKALSVLAWIGDEGVQKTFDKWRRQPPSWCRILFVPPHQYAEQAGWELTAQGHRRNLFTQTARPLILPETALDIDEAVRIGVPAEEKCGWCGRKMVAVIECTQIESLIPNQGVGSVRVVTCHVCACFGPLFVKYSLDGKSIWHPRNQKPSYLPPASEEWGTFPLGPLVISSGTRHFLQAASWSMVPVSFSQLGGLPTWIQDAEYPICPDCSQKMPFIGQISNEDFMKYGEGIYYAFRCQHCNVTATCYQQT